MSFFKTVTPGTGDKSAFLSRAPAPAPGPNTGADSPAATRVALVLHGFSGTPFEIRPLAEGLAARGYTVVAPLLAGHGSTVDDLLRTDSVDWLASAQRAFDQARAEAAGGPVAIAGFSLGGLLALRLACLHPADVVALAVLSPPLRLHPGASAAVRLVARLPTALRRGLLRAFPKRSYDVTDEEMRHRNPGLPALPLQGVASLLDFADAVRKELPQVKTPTLVAHGARDRTVPFSDALEVVASLGSTILERCWLPNSGHLVAIDVDREILMSAVARHFDRTYREVEGRSAADLHALGEASR